MVRASHLCGSRVNDKKDGYNTSIWTVSPATGETQQLTTGIHDSSPRWSPDGKYLVFVRATEKDGRPEPPQLFMLAMAGGDSFQFTTLPLWRGSADLVARRQDDCVHEQRQPGRSGQAK